MSKQKVVIVSGAAQGIGLAISNNLNNHGYTVVGFDTNPDIEQREHGLVADVSKACDVNRVVAYAATLGNVEVLVNNAAVWQSTPIDNSWPQLLEQYEQIINTNVKGVMMLSRLCVPIMQAQKKGWIFNLSGHNVLPWRDEYSSLAAMTNGTNTDLFDASKWALNGFTDAWAKYLADDNIKVNGLCLGAVDTPMLQSAMAAAHTPTELPLLQAQQIAQQLVNIMQSSRSGENFAAWPGESLSLPPLPQPHKKITG